MAAQHRPRSNIPNGAATFRPRPQSPHLLKKILKGADEQHRFAGTRRRARSIQDRLVADSFVALEHAESDFFNNLLEVQPVAKLSDSPGKLLCDDATFLAYLRQVFDVPA